MNDIWPGWSKAGLNLAVKFLSLPIIEPWPSSL